MEASVRQRRMSIEDYIRFEEAAETRHEFDNGKLIAMPGTSDKHNDICFNIKAALKPRLKDSNCRVQIENVKVSIIEGKRFVYPDAFITCDERDLKDKFIKRYPKVIFEVLSDSTRVYDKTDKFVLYKKNIPALEYYILVEPEKIDVEIFSKNDDGTWDSLTLNSKKDILKIAVLGINIPIEELYE
jgi:Uma2 family endonuclease